MHVDVDVDVRHSWPTLRGTPCEALHHPRTPHPPQSLASARNHLDHQCSIPHRDPSVLWAIGIPHVSINCIVECDLSARDTDGCSASVIGGREGVQCTPSVPASWPKTHLPYYSILKCGDIIQVRHHQIPTRQMREMKWIERYALGSVIFFLN